MTDMSFSVWSLCPVDLSLLHELSKLSVALGGREAVPYRDESGTTGVVLVVKVDRRRELENHETIKKSGGILVLCNNVEAGTEIHAQQQEVGRLASRSGKSDEKLQAPENENKTSHSPMTLMREALKGAGFDPNLAGKAEEASSRQSSSLFKQPSITKKTSDGGGRSLTASFGSPSLSEETVSKEAEARDQKEIIEDGKAEKSGELKSTEAPPVRDLKGKKEIKGGAIQQQKSAATDDEMGLLLMSLLFDLRYWCLIALFVLIVLTFFRL